MIPSQNNHDNKLKDTNKSWQNVVIVGIWMMNMSESVCVIFHQEKVRINVEEKEKVITIHDYKGLDNLVLGKQMSGA